MVAMPSVFTVRCPAQSVIQADASVGRAYSVLFRRKAEEAEEALDDGQRTFFFYDGFSCLLNITDWPDADEDESKPRPE